MPSQSMVHHAHFSHPEERKTSVFDGGFDLENAKILEKNKQAPYHQKNQNLFFKKCDFFTSPSFNPFPFIGKLMS